MNENKLIFKNSGLLFFRLIFTSIIGLFSSRFVFRSLGIQDYGLYNVVGGVVIMMGFLNTVMTSTTYHFITFEMGKGLEGKVNKVFNISVIIHIILAFLLLFLTETLGVYYVLHHLNVDIKKIPDALFILRFSTYAMVFSILSIPFQGLVTAQERFDVRIITEIVRSILQFFIALALVYYLGNKLRLYSVLTAIASIIPAMMFYIFCKKSYKEIVTWNFQRDRKKYKQMVGFSSWIMIGAAASVGKNSGTALIINTFFGTMLNAAYGVANQVNGIVMMFAQNLGQAAIPQITKSFSSGNTDRMLTLVTYISKYTFFLMLLTSLPVLLDTKYLLTLWLGKIQSYTVSFSQLMIIIALIESLSSGIPAAIQATGKIKYFQIILSTTSLLGLPIAYFLFKASYSPTAIFYVFIIISFTNIFIQQFLLKKIINFNIKYFLKTAYLKSFYVLVSVIPLFLLHDFFALGFLRFFCYSLFSITYLMITIYYLGIGPTEKKMLNQIFFNSIQKLKNIRR